MTASLLARAPGPPGLVHWAAPAYRAYTLITPGDQIQATLDGPWATVGHVGRCAPALGHGPDCVLIRADNPLGPVRVHCTTGSHLWVRHPLAEPAEVKARTGPHTQWASIAAALRATPGVWCQVVDGLSQYLAVSKAWQIRAGILLPFRPAGAFDAAAADGQIRARYLGPAGAARPAGGGR